MLGDGCKTSDWHSVSSCCVLGVRYKSIKWHLVSSVGLFGSEADVSPVTGVRVPCLPCVRVFFFGVREPNYGSSDSRSRRDT